MTPFQIWKKMIEAKVYTKEVVTTRINVVYAVGQLNDDEYTELINLIETTYSEVV
jgi:hypothetical protein